jgi:nitrogen PTS system EIIA component
VTLTVKDVADILKVSEKSIYRWLADGKMPALRIGGQYRFNRGELLEWAISQRLPASAEFLIEPSTGDDASLNLSEAIKAGGIHYRVGGKDKDSVLRATIDTMHLPEDVDREFLLKVLMARETMGSTGIGEGIAIPHVRNPIVVHVNRPLIALCFLEQPIEFDALDGKPVHTLFAMVSPSARAHIRMLSRLSFVLRDPDLKAKLQQRASREEIVERMRALEGEFKAPGAAPKETPTP